jgi:3-hydroxyisobutyrate dehydrogenase-like beta-hydroxyacid dehydrogenase
MLSPMMLPMETGLIGLGKMGYALALNMRDHGYRVAAFSRSAEKAAAFSADGLEGTSDLGISPDHWAAAGSSG